MTDDHRPRGTAHRVPLEAVTRVTWVHYVGAALHPACLTHLAVTAVAGLAALWWPRDGSGPHVAAAACGTLAMLWALTVLPRTVHRYAVLLASRQVQAMATPGMGLPAPVDAPAPTPAEVRRHAVRHMAEAVLLTVVAAAAVAAGLLVLQQGLVHWSMLVPLTGVSLVVVVCMVHAAARRRLARALRAGATGTVTGRLHDLPTPDRFSLALADGPGPRRRLDLTGTRRALPATAHLGDEVHLTRFGGGCVLLTHHNGGGWACPVD